MTNCTIYDSTTPKGGIIATIIYNNEPVEVVRFPNAVLNTGKALLANYLVEKRELVYVSQMVFGDGGYSQGSKKTITPDRNSLFGITRVKKEVVGQIDPNLPTQAIFTAVIGNQEANGQILNEMALVLNNGDLFSMSTFPDLNKTDQMQIVWNWRILLT